MTDEKPKRKRETRGRPAFTDEQKKVTIFARVMKSTHRNLEKAARRETSTISELVRDAVEKEYGVE